MKVYLSNYRNHWVSPYKILERVLFWKDWENISYDTPWVERWTDRLTPLCQAWRSFLDFVHPPIRYVKIDRWDTWSMDHTLGHIVLPMLRQLQASKHGAPSVDDKDVPDELKSTSAPPKEDEYDVDDNHFRRWDYVLDEMIFAFECRSDDDYEDRFWTGDMGDMKSTETGQVLFNPITNKEEKTYEITFTGNRTCDWDALRAHQDRVRNGFRLFGKYYEALWD